MKPNNTYRKQVQLLVQLLPLINEENCFALKGGTAINLFVRNLPRLSVDIDLVYLPMKERKQALTEIKEALGRISKHISRVLKDSKVVESFKDKEDALRLVVFHNEISVKIELSPVLRGTVYDPKLANVCELVEDQFGFAEITMVNLSDLYAGKICAALDRQHPRDLFDTKWLLETLGLTEHLRKALIVYIISHPRPIVELLNPSLKDLSQIYENEFRNMTEISTSLAELEDTRKILIRKINNTLTDKEKKFLLSFKNKTPDWKLLGLPNVENLPAVKWKLINLSRMKKEKHSLAYDKLAKILLK